MTIHTCPNCGCHYTETDKPRPVVWTGRSIGWMPAPSHMAEMGLTLPQEPRTAPSEGQAPAGT